MARYLGEEFREQGVSKANGRKRFKEVVINSVKSCR